MARSRDLRVAGWRVGADIGGPFTDVFTYALLTIAIIMLGAMAVLLTTGRRIERIGSRS